MSKASLIQRVIAGIALLFVTPNLVSSQNLPEYLYRQNLRPENGFEYSLDGEHNEAFIIFEDGLIKSSSGKGYLRIPDGDWYSYMESKRMSPEFKKKADEALKIGQEASKNGTKMISYIEYVRGAPDDKVIIILDHNGNYHLGGIDGPIYSCDKQVGWYYDTNRNSKKDFEEKQLSEKLSSELAKGIENTLDPAIPKGVLRRIDLPDSIRYILLEVKEDYEDFLLWECFMKYINSQNLQSAK